MEKTSDQPSRDTFTAVYDANAKRIYDYLYYRLRHRETAEDLTTTTFIKAWKSFAKYDPNKGPIIAWLYRIARNTLFDHLRQLKPTTYIDDLWNTLPAKDDVSANAIAHEQLARVNNFLNQLPAQQREVIVLRLWDGLTHAEISQLLGLSEGASKMTFSRAIKQLRQTLGPTALILFLFTPHLFRN